MASAKTLWKRLTHAGISPEMPHEEKKLVLLLNQISATGQIILCLYIVLCLYLERPELLGFTVLGMVCFALTLLFNHFKWHRLSRFYFALIFPFFTFITSWLTGLEGKGQYGFIGTAIIPLVIFSERKNIIGLMLFSVAGFIATNIFLEGKPALLELEPEFYPIANMASFLTVTAIIFLITWYFKSNNEEYQQMVIKQKEVIAEKNREMTESLEYAKNIQGTILPAEEDIKTFFPECFVLFRPKDIVSGDFYWVHQIDESRMLFLVADCTGHGVPGAMMSMIGHSLLSEIVAEKKNIKAGQVLDQLRNKVIKAMASSENKRMDGMDMALCILDRKSNSLEFAGANNGAWIAREGELIELKPDKQPVGFYPEPVPFNSQNIELKKGDFIYLYSDGYADQFGGPASKKFKPSRLKQLLIANASFPANEQKQLLEEEFIKWKGETEQIDDVCVLGVRC